MIEFRMNKPYISVIIPTFNEEKYIHRCLTALKRQRTGYQFEVLLIDHESTDKTRAIARPFDVRIMDEKRRGTAVARQTGAEHAKGEILAFTEADCAPPSDWIDRIGEHFQRHPNDVGITGRYYFDDATPFSMRLSLFLMSLGNYLYRIGRGHYPFRGTNSAGNKAIILKAGGFREEGAPFDDADCSTRVARYGYISYMPNFVVKTSSRRIKGRFFSYAKELIYSSIRVFILKHKGDIRWYKVIR